MQSIMVYLLYFFQTLKGYEMSVLQSYVHELKQNAAVAPCDNTLKNFVLQDALPESGYLKVGSLLIFARRA